MTLETDVARFDLSHKVQLHACSLTYPFDSQVKLEPLSNQSCSFLLNY